MFKEYFSWILIALCAIGIWQFNAQQVESEGLIRILTGKDGTQERYFFEILQQKIMARTKFYVELVESTSLSGRSEKLLRGEAELTIMPLGDPMLKEHLLVHPLWENQLQIIVKKDSDIKNLKDMRTRNIAIGFPESSSRNMATKLLWSQALDINLLGKFDGDLNLLLTEQDMDGAIVSLSPFDPTMRLVMENNKYRFLNVPHAEGLSRLNEGWEESTLPSGLYPTVTVPTPDVSFDAISTLDVLVSSREVPEALLDAVYSIMSEADVYQKVPVLTGKTAYHPQLARLFEKYSHQHAHPLHFAPNMIMNRFFGQASSLLSYTRHIFAGFILALLLFIVNNWMKRRAMRSFDKKSFAYLGSAMHEILVVEDEADNITDVGALTSRLHRMQSMRMEVLDRLKNHELKNSPLFSAFLEQYARISNYLRERIAYEDARER
jgi:hypothetical protein